MTSRRTVLALLGGALTGCVTRRGTRSTKEHTPPADWPPDDWTPAWTHDVPASRVVGLDIVDGLVVITAHDGVERTVMQSFEPSTRSVRWTQELSGVVPDKSMLQRAGEARGWGVTDAGDRLLVVTGTGRTPTATTLHALDRETGAVAWSLTRQRAIAVRGLVDDTVYALARAVKERTTAEPDPEDTAAPRAARLLAVELADGTVRWQRDVTGVGATAADAAGVYLSVLNRLVHVGHDGTGQWTVEGDARGTAVFPSSDVVYHVTTPSRDRLLVRGITVDGTVRWREGFAAEAASHHAGRLYVAGEQFRAIRADGTTAWTTETPVEALLFGPSDGTVYVQSGAGSDVLAAVRLTDGAQQWSVAPPIDTVTPVSATDDTVVAAGDGSAGRPLYRVDAASGAITGRFVGSEQHPFAVRATNAHVFVGVGGADTGGRVLALPS